MEKILGRNEEIDILSKIYTSRRAEFLALYGRRRVGKTFLIHNFFLNKGIYFELTGINKAKTDVQLQAFAHRFFDIFNKGIIRSMPNSWFEAFELLIKTIKTIDSDEKIILFFDELPWLATKRSNFLQALEYFWNSYASKCNTIILIVCGSAASWMITNIIKSKGGLYGRITRTIRLLPFNLKTVEHYLLAANIHLDRKQIIELYMVFGGVPYYLNFIEQGKSSVQNIHDICFKRNSQMSIEFFRVYRSLFEKYENHTKIIKILSTKKTGLTRNEIIKKTGIPDGGGLTNILNELIESGFIMCMSDGRRNKNGILYRVLDEYSLFYMHWLEKLPSLTLNPVSEGYWMNNISTHKWNIWTGLAFENICIKHISEIKSALGIGAVNSKDYVWQMKGKIQRGTQIDLIIDRDDSCINLCEIKFTNSEYTVSSDYAKKLNYKKDVFITETKTKKTIFTTLITTYGAQRNQHYLNSVDVQLTMDIFFNRNPSECLFV